MAYQETKQIVETVSVSSIHIQPAPNPAESRISITYSTRYDKEGEISTGIEGSVDITGADVFALNPDAFGVIVAIADAFNPRDPNRRIPLANQ